MDLQQMRDIDPMMHEEIEKRAYEIYLRRGGGDGRDVTVVGSFTSVPSSGPNDRVGLTTWGLRVFLGSRDLCNEKPHKSFVTLLQLGPTLAFDSGFYHHVPDCDPSCVHSRHGS
jgi:hypothetical protein